MQYVGNLSNSRQHVLCYKHDNSVVHACCMQYIHRLVRMLSAQLILCACSSFCQLVQCVLDTSDLSAYSMTERSCWLQQCSSGAFRFAKKRYERTGLSVSDSLFRVHE